MVGYATPLDITAEARDPDVGGLENSKKNISCIWQCRNLNYGTECKTITGDLINTDNITGMEIHIPKKRL